MAFSLDRALGAKALTAHPALMDHRTPVTTYSVGHPREDAVISQRSAPRHIDAYGGGQAIDHVYDCIGLYSDAVSTAPYRLEQPDGTKLVPIKKEGTPPDHKVGPADLYKLLDKPNPFFLYDELVSLLVIDLMLVGNAYWFKWRVGESGKPLALYRLAPSHVKIKPGPYGPKAYEYKPPGVRDAMKIAPEEIIHFRRPNPHDPYYGMGVIQGAGRSMDLELAITDTMASYYENRADPSMIVTTERRVPRDVFNKLRAQLRARASGSRRAGELLVLEAGLKADTLSTSASDALFDKLAKMSRDRVFTKFRASPMLFGLMDETAGSNKVADVRREFDNYVLRPFMARLARQVTHALCEPWDVRYIIEHQQILPPEEAIKAAESVAKAPGVKIREVRKQYAQFGIEESSGDPEIDEMVINVPGEELDENGQNGMADQPLSSEPGRPPKPANTTAFGVAKVRKPSAKAMSAAEDAMDRLQAVIAARPQAKAVPAERQAPDNRLPGEQRPDDTFASARKLDIDGVTGFIASGLREASVTLERELLDHVEGKALKTSDIVGRIKNSAAWKTFSDRVEAVLTEGARRAAASGVMHSGLEPEDDVDYDALVKSVVHRPEGLRSIIATIRDRVVARVKAARDGNAERTEYEAAVRAVVAEWADSQAALIADSEATEAYNEGTLTAGELAGVNSWLVVEEEDAPDEPCQEARHQVWDTAKARQNRKEHPRCRRAFLALPEGAVA
jgi:HK97 family phage portal protein